MTYKEDFYKTKEKEIDDLFLGYLVPVMEYIEHIALIQECIQKLNSASYDKNLYKDEKLPSRRKLIVMIK